MYIVDSQVHIWAASTPQRPWPQGRHQPHRPVPFSKDDLLSEMNAAGVKRAVIVPPGWEGERNDLGLEAARLHPDRLAVMGRIDHEAPAARDQLPLWRRQPGMLGLRFTYARRPEYAVPLVDGQLDWVWAGAEKAGIPVMMMVTPKQLQYVDRIAARHPELRLIMDHMCRRFGKKDDEAFSGLDKLLELAKRPNVAVKASGMPEYASGEYPYRTVFPFLRRAYDAFGPKRIFWGTDLTKLRCTYRQAVTMFTEEIPWLTDTDKTWIMGRGLCEWLDWKLPS